jgi:hypothetical protein
MEQSILEWFFDPFAKGQLLQVGHIYQSNLQDASLDHRHIGYPIFVAGNDFIILDTNILGSERM